MSWVEIIVYLAIILVVWYVIPKEVKKSISNILRGKKEEVKKSGDVSKNIGLGDKPNFCPRCGYHLRGR